MPNGNAVEVVRGKGFFDVNRKFGIEIEAFNVPMQTLSDALNAAGVVCAVEGYNHNRRANWKIVTDGSIFGQNAFELVSPPLMGEEGFRQIEIVCTVLKRLNAKVNRSTGLHVHHDAADMDVNAVKSVLTMWWKYEDVLLYFLPVSRRANQYAPPVCPRAGNRYGVAYDWSPADGEQTDAWKRALDGVTSLSDVREGGEFQHSRYAPVNCHALSRHGTLEFRSHNGTTEFAKIHAWIVLTQWFLTRSKAKGCQVRTRMTGRWADDSRFFWRAIDWHKVEDAHVIKAKNVLRRRFNAFKAAEVAGQTPEVPVLTREVGGRLRPTPAAGTEDEG